MLVFLNSKQRFFARKRSLIAILAFFVLGFLGGVLYANFSSDDVFLKSARVTDGYFKDENSFSYGFNDEKTLFGIFLSGFFVFGKGVTAFFLFRSGYMLGYFVSFLIKAYMVKGLVSGLVYLFLSLLLCLPWQILLASYAFDCCGYTCGTLFKKRTCVVDLKSFFCVFAVIFLVCLVLTLCGNFLRTKFFLEFIKKIFV